MQISNDGQVELVPPGELKVHPRNPRQGDVGAIHESIQENGFVGALVVQRSTGYVLSGNHTLQAALHHEAEAVPVLWVDVDDERALRILLAMNRASDRAHYDVGALSDLLQELAEGSGLQGTLWEGDDVDELLASLEPPTEGEWMKAFEEAGDTGAADDTAQITFVLPVPELEQLRTHLAKYGTDKNEAMRTWLREALSL